MHNIQLDCVEKLGCFDSVRDIYLFGSVARGDQDDKSDVDILIVIDSCTEVEYMEFKKKCADLLRVPITWMSVYRIDKIRRMQERGSYFLWHIKKEGKKLYSRENELSNLLTDLPRYVNMGHDLEEYGQILDDIINELSDQYICIDYELAVLASLVRNTCITIAYINNTMKFGRNSAVEYCFDKYKMSVSLEEYEKLYQYRLFHTGKIQSVQPGKIDKVKKWIKVEMDLLDIAKKEVIIYERTVKEGME